ncbi:MAG: arylsulfatase [Aureliella sp.]
MGAEHKCLIDEERPTLASLLRDSGYATAMVGKWHLGMDFPGDSPSNRDWSKPTLDMPLDKGFDSFFGIPASLNYGVLAWFDGRHAAVPPTLFTAKKPNSRHVDYRIKPPYQTAAKDVRARGNPVIEVAPDFVDNQCLTRFTDQAISFVTTHTTRSPDKPFFLYLPLTSPHYPVCPLPQFHGQGDCGGYGEFMIETDYHIGRVVNAIKASGQLDNTLIVFSSDNGPEKSWKQRVKDFNHESNRGLREGKRSIYEGGHRVPFIVQWPSGIERPGRSSDRPVCQTDLFATIAEILDQPIATKCAEDSESFLQVFKGDAAARTTPMIHHSVSGQFAIRSGDYKLVLPVGNKSAELYNVATDLKEANNIIEQHHDVAVRLQELASRVIASGRTTAGDKSPNDTPHWNHLNWMTPEQYQQY